MLAIFDVVIVVFVLGAAVVFEVGDFVDSVVGSAAIDKVVGSAVVIDIIFNADIAVELCSVNTLEGSLMLSHIFLITIFL